MRKLGWFALGLGGVACVAFSACGGDDSPYSVFDAGNGNRGDGNVGDSTLGDGNNGDGACTGPFCNSGGDSGACVNLCQNQVTCPPGADGGPVTTTISGTVYDPADHVPLYDVAVYVPNAPLSPIVHGATCDQCGSTLSGDPLVATLTDPSGHFVLQNVPVAANIPLVMQVGKWRRRINITSVNACVDNPITDKTLTRLATKPQETSPDDDIPQIAITTGGADPLECLLPEIGIDPGQFTNVAGGGRVNLYQGNGGSTLSTPTASATNFWADNGSAGTSPLVDYDMVMLGCEGNTYPNEKPASALSAMQNYANVGGRVFGTHYHYYWIQSSPAPWPSTATTWDHGGDPTNQNNWPVLIDQTFPKGQAFAQWMLDNGGSTTLGTFDIAQARHDVDAVDQNPTSNPVSTRWVYSNPTMPNTGDPALVEYYSFNTPVFLNGAPDSGPDGGPAQCGKVVFSDLHIGNENNIGNDPGPFPANCVQTGGLTPQEKALEFLLFDLSSCVQNDTQPPPPPVR
jgi:hypothetical protein